MGEIFHISCANCGFEKNIKTGAGLMSICADVVEQNLQGEDLKQWQELQREENVRSFSWQYEMAYCSACKEMQSCFVVDIHTKNGEKITLGGRCNKCHAKLEMFLHEQDITCPQCGYSGANRQLTGRWD